MTNDQVHTLVSAGKFPGGINQVELVETHISWVLIHEAFVYKIKKPVHYSFLDFSTKAKRKHFCEREVVLNNRFGEGVYLGVVTVTQNDDQLGVDGQYGNVIDYAVKMRKLDRSRQMDQLLINNNVGEDDIGKLASVIAIFHQHAGRIDHFNVDELRDKFNDLGSQADFLERLLPGSAALIHDSIAESTIFLHKRRANFERRCRLGFVRDCHGDLHSRNIFLLPEPIPFDCLEFNDEYRYMDVLDEIAFLCMDLDAFGRSDLASRFVGFYMSHFPIMESNDDHQLFLYYKAYRANIRAKVNCLRAKGLNNIADQMQPVLEAGKYLRLMRDYFEKMK